jgi:hypothetical protein
LIKADNLRRAMVVRCLLQRIGSVGSFADNSLMPAVAVPEVAENAKSGQGDGGPFIRCPRCKWAPRPDDRWLCTECGHTWNTFDTGGVCPSCLYRWTETVCLACRQWSPHSDWYAS